MQSIGGYSNTDSVNLLTGPNWTIVSPKVDSGSLGHSVRIIPAFNAQGEEVPLFNPNPETAKKDRLMLLNDEFCRLQPLIVWARGSRHYFHARARLETAGGLSDVTEHSPAKCLSYRMALKINEQIQLLQSNYPLEIDGARWERVYRAYADSGKYCALQCLAWMVNGVVRTDMNGNQSWIQPAVILLPKSGFNTALASMTTPANPDLPLSAQNNTFGDFASCAGGRMLNVTKTQYMEDGSQKTQYILSLGNLLPLDPGETAEMFRDWNTEVFPAPSGREMTEQLLRLLDPDIVAFGLRGSPWDIYVPEEAKAAAECYTEPQLAYNKDIKISNYVRDGFLKNASERAQKRPVTVASPGRPPVGEPGGMPPFPTTQTEQQRMRQGSTEPPVNQEQMPPAGRPTRTVPAGPPAPPVSRPAPVSTEQPAPGNAPPRMPQGMRQPPTAGPGRIPSEVPPPPPGAMMPKTARPAAPPASAAPASPVVDEDAYQKHLAALRARDQRNGASPLQPGTEDIGPDSNEDNIPY